MKVPFDAPLDFGSLMRNPGLTYYVVQDFEFGLQEHIYENESAIIQTSVEIKPTEP